MSAQTPIYGITYPTDSDLVRDIADHLKTEAQTVEDALHEVDQRARPDAAAPVIAQTYDQLSTLGGVTGQTGYVTNDPSGRNGMYIHGANGWTRGGTTQLGDGQINLANNTGWDATDTKAYMFMGMMLLHGPGEPQNSKLDEELLRAREDSAARSHAAPAAALPFPWIRHTTAATKVAGRRHPRASGRLCDGRSTGEQHNH